MLKSRLSSKKEDDDGLIRVVQSYSGYHMTH